MVTNTISLELKTETELKTINFTANITNFRTALLSAYMTL